MPLRRLSSPLKLYAVTPSTVEGRRATGLAMPDHRHAAETMARCPGCRKDIRADPEPECPLCKGAGLVSGKLAAEYRSNASNVKKSE